MSQNETHLYKLLVIIIAIKTSKYTIDSEKWSRYCYTWDGVEERAFKTGLQYLWKEPESMLEELENYSNKGERAILVEAQKTRIHM